MRRTPKLVLSLFAALALVLAGCGGDDDSSSDAEQQAEDALSERLGGECGFLAEFAGAFEGFDPSESMGSEGESLDFGTFYGELADQFQEVADAAPDEIQDAFEAMAATLSDVADDLEGYELDLSDPENVDLEALAAIQSVGDSFDDEFADASEEVDDWIQENCSGLGEDFDFGSTGGGLGG